nr:serglycin [Thamnaconus modestus]
MKFALVVALCCLALHYGHGAPRSAVYKYVKCNPEGDRANCVTYQSPRMPWSADLPDKLPASEASYLEAEAVEDKELSQAGKDKQLDEKDKVMMQDEEYEDEYLDDDYEEEELKGNEYEDEMVVKEDEDEAEDKEEEEDDMLGDEQEENTMLEEEEEDKMPLLVEEGESPMSFLPDEGSGSEEGSGGGITDQLFMPFESDAGSGESMTEEEPNTVRHSPSLRDILKWPQVGAEKPAEKEMKEDHLMNA